MNVLARDDPLLTAQADYIAFFGPKLPLQMGVGQFVTEFDRFRRADGQKAPIVATL